MLLSKVTYSAFRLYIFLSVCVPFELNPQHFALLTQSSSTEPQEHLNKCNFKYISEKYIKSGLRVYFPIFIFKEIQIAHLNKLLFRKGVGQ